MRSIIALVLMLALLLSGCGGSSYRSVKQIQEDGTLRVAVNPSGQPYAWVSTSGYRGSEVTFVESLARQLGVNAVYTEYASSEALEAVRTGEADIAIGRLSSISAPSNLGFTVELGRENVCLLARQPERYDTIGSLEGRISGLVEGTVAAAIFQRNDETLLEWLWYPSLDAAVSGLLEGDISVVVCTEQEAAAVMELAGGQLTANALINGQVSRYAAAVHGSNMELLELANALLEAPYLVEDNDEEA